MNDYKLYFDNFLEGISELKGRALSSSSFLREYTKYLVENDKNIRKGSIVVFHDRTKKVSHLGASKHTFFLDKNNISKLSNEFIVSNHNNYFSKYLEMLSGYIKDITAAVIFNDTKLQKKYAFISKDFDGIRNELSTSKMLHSSLKKRTDLRHLFIILREASSSYKGYETSNYLDINLFELYKTLAFLRHIITHQNSKLRETDIGKLNQFKVIIERFFNLVEDGDDVLIELKEHSIHSIDKTFCEFAFIIYKSVSVDNNVEWDFYTLK
jgi:hypothetical protein